MVIPPCPFSLAAMVFLELHMLTQMSNFVRHLGCALLCTMFVRIIF